VQRELGLEAYVDTSEWPVLYVNLFVAFELNELVDFVRLPLVIATTPAVATAYRGLPVAGKAGVAGLALGGVALAGNMFYGEWVRAGRIPFPDPFGWNDTPEDGDER